jgi:hypothetical protein
VVELNRVNGRHTYLSGSVCMADDVVVDTADEHSDLLRVLIAEPGSITMYHCRGDGSATVLVPSTLMADGTEVVRERPGRNGGPSTRRPASVTSCCSIGVYRTEQALCRLYVTMSFSRLALISPRSLNARISERSI